MAKVGFSGLEWDFRDSDVCEVHVGDITIVITKQDIKEFLSTWEENDTPEEVK